MELYVMILDDEEIILDGLVHFPWQDYGCTVIAQAENGEKGIEILETSKPDIILSDIKMPGMDGLEFCKRAKEICPEAEVVLLTGYDNFQFAQQAIHIGVSEYLLKPVNYREMHTAVAKVCEIIREKRKRQKDYAQLKEKYRETIPAVRRKTISDLIYGRFNDKAEMHRRMDALHMYIESYVLIYGSIQERDNMDKPELEPNLFDFVVCNVCQETLQQAGRQVYSESDNLGYCFVVTFPIDMDNRKCEEKCVQACEEIQENLRKIIRMDISFGVSQREMDSLNMNHSYVQALEACEQSTYLDENCGILTYTDIADVELPIWQVSDGQKKRLLSKLMQGNVKSAKKFIQDIFTDCPDIEVMRYNVMELILLCAQYLSKDSIDARVNKESNAFVIECLKRIYAGNTRQDVLQTLKVTLGQLAEKKKDENISRNERTAKQMIEYIEENYEQDLSLDTLADYFKLSKTYINRLLKIHSEKSFLEILSDYRMKKAEELIAEGKYKIYEIAERVGYHDQSYFIRVFKKKYGITPNAYKRN